ncbi:MAG: hypothetical protein JSS12_10380 [Verrucomicrobia bacterium]|nr:hypothetical protein [Verrucomicrobiota bacterium]
MKILLIILLCVSCASSRTPQPETLQVRNAPAIVLTCKKALTVETKNAGPINYYVFDAKKVPPNRKYHLQYGDRVHPTSALDVVSDEYGELYLASDRTCLLREQPNSMNYYLPGQEESLWLVSEDGSIAVCSTFIPYPLIAYGADGAELSLIRQDLRGTEIECHGRYFTQNEQIEISLESDDFSKVRSLLAHKGRFDLSLASPTTFGGIVTVKATRQNGETLTLSYPFGRESFNKDAYLGNPAKLQDTDLDQIEEALKNFYNKTTHERLT